MSTPSPEAKQAAEEIDLSHCNLQTAQNVRRAYALGYDAATAKLREELELAWGIIANAGGGDWSKESQEWEDAAAKWRDRVMSPMYAQPAHQQPSATAPIKEPQESVYRGEILPSATTSAVEKIALECASVVMQRYADGRRGYDIIEPILQALAQAHEKAKDERETKHTKESRSSSSKIME